MARTRPSPPPLPVIPRMATEFSRTPDYTAAATGPRDLANVAAGSGSVVMGETQVVTPDPFVTTSS